jgi:hypothetical protein
MVLLPQKLSPSSQKCELGIRDPRSGSRGQKGNIEFLHSVEREGAECGSATLGLFALLSREEKQPRLEISISTDACILISSPRTIGEEEEVCRSTLWTTTIQQNGRV